MKKILCGILAGVMILSMTACGGSSGGSQAASSTAQSTAAKSSAVSSADAATIKDLEIDSWTIHTPRGINTLVLTVKNPNSVAVDTTFNVSYIKGGKEIKVSQDIYFNCIPAGKTQLTLDTWEIPEAADEIKLQYTYLKESVYKPVPVSVAKEEKSGKGLNVALKVDGDFSSAGFGIKYLNGGKVVAYDLVEFFSGETLETTEEEPEAYDSYELYPYAYK